MKVISAYLNNYVKYFTLSHELLKVSAVIK